MSELYAQMSGPSGMMHDGWGGFMIPGLMWLGPLFWLLVIALAVWGLVALFRRNDS